jgi:hypothetical protein
MLIQPSIDRWRYGNNQQGNPKDQQHGVDHVPHFSLLVITCSEATNHIGRADSPQSVSQRLFEKMTLMGLHREAVPSKLKGQHHDSDCGNPARNGAAGKNLPIRPQSLQTHQKIEEKHGWTERGADNEP